MTVNIYRLWLDSEQMQRYRRGREEMKRFEAGAVVLFYGLWTAALLGGVFIPILLKVYFQVGDDNIFLLFFKYMLLLSLLIILIFSLFQLLEKDFNSFLYKTGTFLWTRLPGRRQWLMQHSGGDFDGPWLKAAKDAGVDGETAAKALVEFKAGGDIGYPAFEEYCRQQAPVCDETIRAAEEAERRQREQAAAVAAVAAAALADRQQAAAERQAVEAAWNDRNAVHVSANW